MDVKKKRKPTDASVCHVRLHTAEISKAILFEKEILLCAERRFFKFRNHRKMLQTGGCLKITVFLHFLNESG